MSALPRRLAALGLAAAAFGLAACGSSGTSSMAPAPKDINAPATGTLRVFAYDDTVTDDIIGPFSAQNPDVDMKIATFNSDEEAAAKLAGGFSADVVEVCADEMRPLEARGLLRPLDVSAFKSWDKLAFTDAQGVEQNGDVLFVPLSAGPQGLIVNTDEVSPVPSSWNDLFDPAFQDRVALDGSSYLTPLAETALTMGIDDPMNMSADELDQVQQKLIDERDQFRSFADSDSDMVNLFKSGEVVVSDGGRGTTQDMLDDGLPVQWVAPKEGALSWICGLGITSKAENVDAAYKFINFYTGPEPQAASAQNGFVVTNPAAIPVTDKQYRDTADPASIKGAIPESQPSNFQEYAQAWREVKAQ
jgi:spermidine/putrescine-binding protein